MSLKKLYGIYGVLVLALGLLGFCLTAAKSALITGLAAGTVFLILSFVIKNNKVIIVFARFCNIALIGAFAWRFVKAMSLFSAGDESKLIPMALLFLLALLSVSVFLVSVIRPKI